MDITKLLKKKGIRKIDIANRLGIYPQNVARLFRNPTESSIRHLAKVIGCEPWEFFATPEEVFEQTQVNVNRCPHCGSPNLLDGAEAPDSIEENEHIKVPTPDLDEARRKRLEQYTIFALFLPHTRLELTGEIVENDEPYPRQFREVKRYKTIYALGDAYDNTSCPGSQMICAKDERDYEEQLELWNERYDDIMWLRKNLFPYL